MRKKNERKQYKKNQTWEQKKFQDSPIGKRFFHGISEIA